jgi:hypothetical protein
VVAAAAGNMGVPIKKMLPALGNADILDLLKSAPTIF